jgi:hypothetical protein
MNLATSGDSNTHPDWTIIPTSTPSAESHSMGPKEVEDHRRVQGLGGNSIAATPQGFEAEDMLMELIREGDALQLPNSA